MQGTIFNIQRYCTKDGPGIRTTVFLKGCPLHCLWCHNPESQTINQAIQCDDLQMSGCQVSVEEIMKEILKDKLYYENSGGGVTLSGGEPLAQYDFTLEILQEAKRHHIHTAIETCGFAERAKLERIAEFVDVFLFDYKETNPELHRRFTGVDNTLIMENLESIDKLQKDIILRCPLIPGYNDRQEHFRGIANVANTLKNIQRIELEPYHSLGMGKYKKIGKEYELSHVKLPDDDMIDLWKCEIQKNTAVRVNIA